MNKIIPTLIDYTYTAFDVNTFDSSNAVMTPLIALSADLSRNLLIDLNYKQ